MSKYSLAESSYQTLLQRNSKYIEWRHIRGVYEKVHAMATKSSGLSLLPKLTYEHVHLSSMSKMRVDLAAQVGRNPLLHLLVYINIFLGAEHVCCQCSGIL